ncbi:hypothetical protein PLICRDRAFT_35866 [Plicaturopsis crispa FD-325 SS-3]|nr:hypothetical protein PLICRDRAFT_35866 [Plicaturopsis crispa FD-325 SS-3]
MSDASAPNVIAPEHAEIEFVFLGTGTSSSVPHIECLTAPPDAEPCRTCTSTLTPEGKKNIRRNTSAAFRINAKDGRLITVVIDVGKNFQAAAIEWFPKYGMRRIDAVLITHAHADAMNGLDDLRGWTLNHNIQSHIDLYVSQATYLECQRSFPYLVSKEFASGGGDVPDFKWHIFEDKVPFEIDDTGIEVTPFSVHHGRIFSTVPPPAYVPTPNGTVPSTPVVTPNSTPARRSSPIEGAAKTPETIHPYICFGFKIRHLVYISDVSHIPDDTWSLLEQPRPDEGPLPVFVLDCLRLHPHTSHLGFGDSVKTARRLAAQRTYLTGFGHEVSHDEYVRIGEAVGGADVESTSLTKVEAKGVSLIGEGQPLWLRPAHDGLRIFISEDGRVRDETYD